MTPDVYRTKKPIVSGDANSPAMMKSPSFSRSSSSVTTMILPSFRAWMAATTEARPKGSTGPERRLGCSICEAGAATAASAPVVPANTKKNRDRDITQYHTWQDAPEVTELREVPRGQRFPWNPWKFTKLEPGQVCMQMSMMTRSTIIGLTVTN